MEILFGLYLIALGVIFFIGFMAVRDVINNSKRSSLDRIAELQHWEYLRSLDKDANKQWRS